jgi:siderophore synthetase component
VSEDLLFLAERASFEAFATCYTQELGAGTWHRAATWRAEQDPDFCPQGELVLVLELPREGLRLAIDVIYHSAVGRHRLGAVRCERSGRWRDADRLHAVLSLVRELYSGRASVDATARAHELELLLRYVQSQQLMARYLEARAHDRGLDSDRFIDSEQSMLYGHWRHPTPKSRQGMTEWQHDSFAPELRGRFQLHYFAVKRALVRQQSALPHSAEALLARMLVGDAPAERALRVAHDRGEVLLPVHPLQVDWLMHQRHVQSWLADGLLRDVGRLGPRFTATSSVRTVYNEDCEWMIKLSIPVKITNSLRFNRRAELPAGVSMARLFAALGERAGFHCIADPAYLTVEGPDAGESGFELLLRENPFQRGSDSGIYCVAALVQEALPHRASRLRTLLEGLALTEGRDVQQVSCDWLGRYLSCVIEPLIRLYDEHGIALEAHQQNSLLDLRAGYPRAFYFRDSQGYYLSNQHRARLIALQPELLQRPELFFDDQLIQRRFAYYLFSNHLFAVVQRLGADELLDEDVALAIVKSRLTTLAGELCGQGRLLLESVLERSRLPYKANLLTRVHDVDELTSEQEQAVYVEVENPFLRALQPLPRELEVA